MAVSLGFAPGQVVQEFYYDEDVDSDVRSAIEQETGNTIEDTDYGDVVDGVVIWWRSDDAEEEDLADVLMDALTNLDEQGGVIWVLSPKTGRAGEVSMGDIEEASRTCGLQCTSSAALAKDWAGMRLVSRGRVR